MTGEPPDDEDERVGYGRPPKSTRFQKGRSPNPQGRPPGRRREIPYELILGELVTIRENGVERRVRADEAFLLQLTKRGAEGDTFAAQAILAGLADVKSQKGAARPIYIVRHFLSHGSVTYALEALRIAKKLDQYRETARMAIEPWAVEAALARLEKPLTPEQQRTVLKSTRTPRKVRWPKWWTERP